MLSFNYWVYSTLMWKIFQSSEIFKFMCALEGHVLLSWTSVLFGGIYYTESSGSLMQSCSASPGIPTNFWFSCRWPVLGCQRLQHRARLPQAYSEPGLPLKCRENRCSCSWSKYQKNLFLCRQQVLEVRLIPVSHNR